MRIERAKRARMQAATTLWSLALVGALGCGKAAPPEPARVAAAVDKSSREDAFDEPDEARHAYAHAHGLGHSHFKGRVHIHHEDGTEEKHEDEHAHGKTSTDPLAVALTDNHDHDDEEGVTVETESVERLEDRSTKSLVDELLSAADEGQRPGELTQHLGERGGAAIEALAARVDLKKPKQAAAIIDVLAIAGRSRRYTAELLRLYDPPAWRIFYTDEGQATQTQLGALLALPEWPRDLPAAMIRSAPAPTLAWLAAQARADQPRLAQARLIARQWSQWISLRNERQFSEPVQRALVELLGNPAVQADPAALADIVRAVGDAQATAGGVRIAAALAHANVDVRRQAARALGKLKATAALDALSQQAEQERDPEVLAAIAAALGGWPTSELAAKSLASIFHRATGAGVKREVLYSIAESNSPLRTALLKDAFAQGSDGVLGVALLAMAHDVPAELTEPLLKLAGDSAEPQPALIDALGALRDARATKYLARCLEKEPNAPVRLKAALALEKIGDAQAAEALLAAFNDATDPLLVEQLAGIVGNLKLAAAAPTLIALAEDLTAPMGVRAAAIWSLGAFEDTQVAACLARLTANPAKYFGHADAPELAAADAERIELAELFLIMAALRLGASDGAARLDEHVQRGAATTQLSALLMLARLKVDHPLIERSLASTELAVLLSAVRAAGATSPQKYHAQLVALRDSPWLDALFASSADTLNLRRDLDAAIAAGEKESR